MKTLRYTKLQIQRLLNDSLITSWIAIGVVIVVFHQLNSNITRGPWNPNPTAYQMIIGFDFSSLSSLYYLILPIIASVAGVTLVAERQYNHSDLLEKSRINKHNYLLANTLAALLVGGIITSLPLIVDSLVAFVREQGMIIDPFTVQGQVIPTESSYFKIFLNHPIAFLVGYIALTFMFSGGYAIISFLMFLIFKKKV
ncbi:hypothetical protein KG087_02200 [Lacticaseibacillus zeae]|nr:hypothetical protein [Lacticaseibacillus zeae]QVI32473.1 hypothetical protein KG087_02200 [Lacticaseibacillus zeae]